jgi:hypothetical protein
VPITLAHPSFIPLWQELHDHIFNVPVHPLCLELIPDFQPTSEVICSSPFLTSVFNHTPLYWSWFCHLSTGYSAYPTCQDKPLQYRRPNLCFGMSISYSGSTDV